MNAFEARLSVYSLKDTLVASGACLLQLTHSKFYAKAFSSGQHRPDAAYWQASRMQSNPGMRSTIYDTRKVGRGWVEGVWVGGRGVPRLKDHAYSHFLLAFVS